MRDLFGYEPPGQPFRDIRNQRDSVADEKAELCAVLNRMLRAIPASINSASINRTRAYMAERKRALKVLESTKSSRTELMSAINSMRQFEAGD